MAPTDGFKHITVKQSTTDDEVIFAGISDDAQESVQEDVHEDAVTALERVDDDAALTADTSNIQQEYEQKTSQTQQQKAKRTRDSKGRARKEPEYHETTLEDLNSVKMPFAQKVVILTAILLIIIACCYYFMVLR